MYNLKNKNFNLLFLNCINTEKEFNFSIQMQKDPGSLNLGRNKNHSGIREIVLMLISC